ncbi:bis(5'-nucleosyl)-tetraphosphatase (symmetrical) YqeK [Paenibacillus sp. JCM 10914]|uniref:bis(5'-nucleosyl)-tetraphosphatase (symmetrical) YqeK n=1 Tax=Paenibacillus sp. JCM 10914 TaxID=1236974 RepID=UPI0003CC2CBC|nr:bis(5'-nucleosyl)-tetraphosphatase (symmetrical) YqeK [Paenibacillus sp. JCM 10914]GAE05120.1 aminopeptidase YpdF [Paenibacillus sp. JCM 10914]
MNTYRELRTPVLTGHLREDVFRFLNDHQCPKTADHVLRVGDEARRIATLYSANPTAAQFAGYLHDISAVFPSHTRVEVAREIGIDVLPEEEQFPMIIHQKISQFMAEDLFGITDTEILHAIGCHTTLRGNSSRLDRVVFVADKIEWDQVGCPPYLKTIQDQLHKSLEHAAFAYLQYLWDRRDSLRVIHPWLADAYYDLKDMLSRDERRQGYDNEDSINL